MFERTGVSARSPIVLPRRIVVAGSSGSGKSTLAAEVAARFALPYTDLDSLFHGPSWTPRPSFIEDVTVLARTEAWVSEWNYRSARPILLERAELIICLDYARVVVMSRVIRRTLHRWWHRTELWNGNQEPALRTVFSDREHVVRWSWATFRRNRQMMRDLAAAPPPGLQVVVLRSPRQTRAWLARCLASPVPS